MSLVLCGVVETMNGYEVLFRQDAGELVWTWRGTCGMQIV
jgi:hypothetical protein